MALSSLARWGRRERADAPGEGPARSWVWRCESGCAEWVSPRGKCDKCRAAHGEVWPGVSHARLASVLEAPGSRGGAASKGRAGSALGPRRGWPGARRPGGQGRGWGPGQRRGPGLRPLLRAEFLGDQTGHHLRFQLTFVGPRLRAKDLNSSPRLPRLQKCGRSTNSPPFNAEAQGGDCAPGPTAPKEAGGGSDSTTHRFCLFYLFKIMFCFVLLCFVFAGAGGGAGPGYAAQWVRVPA